jgi:hypothetical protein
MPTDADTIEYRMIWPANVLERQGFEVILVPPKKGQGFLAKTTQDANGNEFLTSIQMPDHMDVVVLQRPCHPLQPQMIDILRQNGVAVVIDMDDDMSNIHPDNAAYHMYRPGSGSPFSWKHAMESCKRATLVTASTPALLKIYAKHGRGVVLNNFVPKAYLSFPKEDTGAFGWAGTTKSHPNDLQVTGKMAQRLVDEGHPFRVVGGDKHVKAAFKLNHDPDMTGTVGIAEWAKTIADTIDVGMVPLAATAFNSSKSRLKGIEMMAVGIPWVASPRAEYRTLVKESGCGLLAETPKDWYSQLKRLLRDDVLRKEQAEAGRMYMQDQTYEAQAHQWWDAWTRAYEIQHS